MASRVLTTRRERIIGRSAIRQRGPPAADRLHRADRITHRFQLAPPLKKLVLRAMAQHGRVFGLDPGRDVQREMGRVALVPEAIFDARHGGAHRVNHHPRRALAEGMGYFMAVPYGDMMLSGCFGLVAALKAKLTAENAEVAEIN